MTGERKRSCEKARGRASVRLWEERGEGEWPLLGVHLEAPLLPHTVGRAGVLVGIGMCLSGFLHMLGFAFQIQSCVQVLGFWAVRSYL